jgi:transcription initiation factor IIE alpha subunit
MSAHRQIVREYIRVTEALLKTDEFTDDEIQAIGTMLDQLSKKLLDARMDGKP